MSQRIYDDQNNNVEESDSINTNTENYPLQFTTDKGKTFKVIDEKTFLERSAQNILF